MGSCFALRQAALIAAPVVIYNLELDSGIIKKMAPADDLNLNGNEERGCKIKAKDITVERVATATLPTETGDFKIAGYHSLTSDEEFVVLFKGEMQRDVPTLVRIHSQCLTGDVFGSIKCDCGPQLHRTMEMIEAEGR